MGKTAPKENTKIAAEIINGFSIPKIGIAKINIALVKQTHLPKFKQD